MPLDATEARCWSVYEPNDSLNLANLGTVDHYDLYYATNCTANCSSYTLIDHSITQGDAGCSMTQYPTVNCSGISLDKYSLPSGSYGIFVQAVGEPGITNWLTPTGAYYTVP